mgnify:CR=1 FL=1
MSNPGASNIGVIGTDARKGLNNLLRGHMAVLRGARSLAYLVDMSRSLRSVRLALRPLATVFQAFFKRAAGSCR